MFTKSNLPPRGPPWFLLQSSRSCEIKTKTKNKCKILISFYIFRNTPQKAVRGFLIHFPPELGRNCTKSLAITLIPRNLTLIITGGEKLEKLIRNTFLKHFLSFFSRLTSKNVMLLLLPQIWQQEERELLNIASLKNSRK